MVNARDALSRSRTCPQLVNVNERDRLRALSSSDTHQFPDACVELVVTSPPHFVSLVTC
jgi:hypothetical protein